MNEFVNEWMNELMYIVQYLHGIGIENISLDKIEYQQ